MNTGSLSAGCNANVVHRGASAVARQCRRLSENNLSELNGIRGRSRVELLLRSHSQFDLDREAMERRFRGLVRMHATDLSHEDGAGSDMFIAHRKLSANCSSNLAPSIVRVPSTQELKMVNSQRVTRRQSLGSQEILQYSSAEDLTSPVQLKDVHSPHWKSGHSSAASDEVDHGKKSSWSSVVVSKQRHESVGHMPFRKLRTFFKRSTSSTALHATPPIPKVTIPDRSKSAEHGMNITSPTSRRIFKRNFRSKSSSGSSKMSSCSGRRHSEGVISRDISHIVPLPDFHSFCDADDDVFIGSDSELSPFTRCKSEQICSDLSEDSTCKSGTDYDKTGFRPINNNTIEITGMCVYPCVGTIYFNMATVIESDTVAGIYGQNQSSVCVVLFGNKSVWSYLVKNLCGIIQIQVCVVLFGNKSVWSYLDTGLCGLV